MEPTPRTADPPTAPSNLRSMTRGDNSPEHSDYWAVRRTVDRYFAAIDRADKSLLAGREEPGSCQSRPG